MSVNDSIIPSIYYNASPPPPGRKKRVNTDSHISLSAREELKNRVRGGGGGIIGLRRKSARGAARCPEGGAGGRERGQGGKNEGEDGRSVGA